MTMISEDSGSVEIWIVVIMFDVSFSLTASDVMVVSDVEVSGSGDMFSVTGLVDSGNVGLVNNSGAVMTAFGEHVLGPTQNVTSARWTQLESRKKVNCRSSCGVLDLGSKHTFMRELHEVTSWLIVVVDIRVASVTNARTETLSTPIPHCGQLNITTSTLSTLVNVGVRKSNVMSMLEAVVCIVSSRLAHMSPSSPVSVGIPLSNTYLSTKNFPFSGHFHAKSGISR